VTPLIHHLLLVALVLVFQTTSLSNTHSLCTDPTTCRYRSSPSLPQSIRNTHSVPDSGLVACTIARTQPLLDYTNLIRLPLNKSSFQVLLSFRQHAYWLQDNDSNSIEILLIAKRNASLLGRQPPWLPNIRSSSGWWKKEAGYCEQPVRIGKPLIFRSFPSELTQTSRLNSMRPPSQRAQRGVAPTKRSTTPSTWLRCASARTRRAYTSPATRSILLTLRTTGERTLSSCSATLR